MLKQKFDGFIDDMLMKSMGLILGFKDESIDPLSDSGFIKLRMEMDNEIIEAMFETVSEQADEVYQAVSGAESESEITEIINGFIAVLMAAAVSAFISSAVVHSVEMAELSKNSQLDFMGGTTNGLSKRERQLIEKLAEKHSLFVEEYYGSVLKGIADRILASELEKTDDVQAAAAVVASRLKNLIENSTKSYVTSFSTSVLNRSRNFGILKALDQSGIVTFSYDNPRDERTTEFCWMISEIEISVPSALEIFDLALDAVSVQDLRNCFPFITKREINENIVYTLNSGSEKIEFTPEQIDASFMADHNLLIPPFHYLCRTRIVVQESKGLFYNGQKLYVIHSKENNQARSGSASCC